MKVAVVCPYGLEVPGGVQNQAVSLVEWLRAEGDDAWVVAPGSGGPDGTRHVGATTPVPANRSRARLALDPRVVGRVRAAISDAEVVHIHEPFQPMVSLGALISGGPPKVGTFHADPGGGVRTAYAAGGFLLRSWARKLAVATAVSPVAQRGVAGICTARIIPNAIDIAAFAVDEPRIAGRVAFLGRDEPRKGLDVLLDAWPLASEWVPDAELVVIGAAREDAPEGVVFHPDVEDDEKRRLLASSSVVCAPNLGGESFGLVLVEAMAAGCAIVASAIPAFVAVVGEAGVLVAPGDTFGLGTSLGELLANPDRIDALAGMGRIRAQSFDAAEVFPRYRDAYYEALAGV